MTVHENPYNNFKYMTDYYLTKKIQTSSQRRVSVSAFSFSWKMGNRKALDPQPQTAAPPPLRRRVRRLVHLFLTLFDGKS